MTRYLESPAISNTLPNASLSQIFSDSPPCEEMIVRENEANAVKPALRRQICSPACVVARLTPATLRLPCSKPDDVSGAATVHYLRLAFSSIRLARSLA
jgi:hypothetical protein